MNQELPQISNYCTSSNAISVLATDDQWKDQTSFHLMNDGSLESAAFNTLHFKTNQAEVEEEMPSTRIVQVFIADPDEDVPVEQRLIYQDEKPYLTELTNEELFFTIPVMDLLKSHNEVRESIVDRERSNGDRDLFLEKIRIRDLKMVVAEIAAF